MPEHKYEYTSILRANLFKNKDKELGSKQPDFSNGNLQITVPIEAGRYRIAGWQYEDSGNISLNIERVEEKAGADSGGF
jgi:hypothetical protein|tara:strand:- start:250 stop:486 length:237 start_codon:yes stop_codon:yes gene_type:complete